MEKAVKEGLQTSILKDTHISRNGCVNNGQVYLTDQGNVFIKQNGKEKAREMFDGEYESLKALHDTNLIKVPKPLLVVDDAKGGAALVMEYLEFKGLTRKANLLGNQVARLHLHNIELEERSKVREQDVGASEKDSHVPFISQFGFNVPTSCGYILQNNDWCDDWPTFYGRKLQDQMNLIEKEYGDREALCLWSSLKVKLPEFFKGMDVKPSLLHGDLWSGNVGETQSEPVMFDPGSFYGHHEYDLAIAGMFGGFPRAFWDSYHDVIPKADGWDRRHKLYIFFHNLNHWNHFGSGYRSGSLDIIKGLVE